MKKKKIKKAKGKAGEINTDAAVMKLLGVENYTTDEPKKKKEK